MASRSTAARARPTSTILRGFNLDHGTDFATTVAGVPVNMPTHAHGHGYTDANFLIPELVTGVQYFKGPYSADAGDFSSAGGAHHQLRHRARSADAARQRRRAGLGAGVRGRVAARGSAATCWPPPKSAHNDGPWDAARRLPPLNRCCATRAATPQQSRLTAPGLHGSWNSTDQVPRRAIDDGTLPRFGSDRRHDRRRHRRGTASLPSGSSTAAASRSRLTALRGAPTASTSSRTSPTSSTTPPDGDQFHQADRRFVSGCARPTTAWRSPANGRSRLVWASRSGATTSAASASTARARGNGFRRSARMPWTSPAAASGPT